MPYITKALRNEERLAVATVNPTNAGELNYVITEICQQYFHNTTHNYQAINDIIGALEGAKLEFYRRLASPYEDQKITENGDVYFY